MATVALVPNRVAPASIRAMACSAVRMPPEAFTPIVGPTAWRRSATSSTVAPARPEAGGGLHEIRPGLDGQAGGPDFLLRAEQGGLQDHLADGSRGVGHRDDRLQIRPHRLDRPGRNRPMGSTMSSS
jgi:hypothetical protein